MAIASGSELRRCCNSWSVVVEGTRRPWRLPTRSLNFPKTGNRGNAGRTCGESAYYPSTANGGVHDWDDIGELALEGRVEVCTALYGAEAVAVCEF